MKLFPFKASYPNMELIAAADTFLNTISKEFIQYKNAGFFSHLEKKALYIYRIQGARSYTGIIGSNEIADIEDGKILGHENTIAEKEQNMLSLMLTRKAMIKPVLLAYEDHSEIQNFITDFVSKNNPLYEITTTEGKEVHIVWALTAALDISTIQQLFNIYIDKAYIADGHHRASITSRLVRKNYLHDHDDDKHPGLLCAFFPFSELTIYDFSRVLKFSDKMSDITLVAGLSQYFDIKKLNQTSKPEGKHQLTIILKNECFELTWKQNYLSSSHKSQVILDVELFNQLIVNELLGIQDVRTTNEISYVEGIVNIEDLALIAKNQGTAVFNFFPLSFHDVKTISDAGDVLPPKSTWFEPRMKNGLLIKEF
jgi:uncharacterized protein (DUF1015 family)